MNINGGERRKGIQERRKWTKRKKRKEENEQDEGGKQRLKQQIFLSTQNESIQPYAECLSALHTTHLNCSPRRPFLKELNVLLKDVLISLKTAMVAVLCSSG